MNNQNQISLIETRIVSQDINNLVSVFFKNTYRARDDDVESNSILDKCIGLMKLDYNVSLISNSNGELSSQYPGQCILLESERISSQSTSEQRQTTTIYENSTEECKLRDLINKARFARCRARFPLPVILYKGKYICRSSTLSGGPEIYGRSGIDYLFYGSESSSVPDDNIDTNNIPNSQSDWQLFNRYRHRDIELLKTFNVGTIVDFMVENKKVKFGVNVTSSEKVDKENRYSNFNIISLPYPGCEFFREFRDNNYTARHLQFDWSQTHVDATIRVPEDIVINQLNIKWENYKQWDLVELTQNYMKLMIKYIQEGNTSLLIHCISGWDRTPLFISLLRISLWADGVIHQSLDVQQILYLTVAYDWMLFGHHLTDRVSKGEDILYFCFYMLKHLNREEFSIFYKQKTINRHASEKTSVMRTDSDLHLDGMLLDQDSRGSNISLNSSCSSVSSKSQDQQSNSFSFADEAMNGNAQFVSDLPVNQLLCSPQQQQRRTSPVAVPMASRFRQRQESTSSGSWQMISGTGSLRTSESCSTVGSLSRGDLSQESSCTVIDEEFPQLANVRKDRMLRLRTMFYSIYSTNVGLRFKGTDSAITSFLGHVAEKVGLSQRT